MKNPAKPAAVPVVHGIPNCDTVKRARAWLAGQGVASAFHDFRKDGVPAARLDAWIAALGWQTLLNQRGTTWRRLDDATRAAAADAAGARALMVRESSVIKRPVVDWPDGRTTVGFDPDDWATRV
jgi:arsenate reductase